ncbi:MAG TPA: hypothetical protein VJR03_03860 [Nitrospira sp.]|nr:hypothetical protein [Nitrospira sp.]
MISRWWARALLAALVGIPACNSDVPVAAVAEVGADLQVTVTRVATHPFLARFNLKLTVNTRGGCSAISELFPDTGAVSRRNVYREPIERLYVVGQFDVRRFDLQTCRIELMEFRSLQPGLLFVGSFDIDDRGRWRFFPADERPEQPFQPL